MQVDLPVDPGVVLLDIAFTGNDVNHGMPSSISIPLFHSPKQASKQNFESSRFQQVPEVLHVQASCLGHDKRF